MDESKKKKLLSLLPTLAPLTQTEPDDVHLDLAVRFLQRLKPEQRPKTRTKLEGVFFHRGCCSHRVDIPVGAVAAEVIKLPGMGKTYVAEFLRILAESTAVPAPDVALVLRAAVQVIRKWVASSACEDGPAGAPKFCQVLRSCAWSLRRVGPPSLVLAMISKGLLSQKSDGELVYDETALAAFYVGMKEREASTPDVAGPHVSPEKVQVTLGHGALAMRRTKSLRQGGLDGVVAKWVQSICAGAKIDASPKIEFTKKGAMLSFAFSPYTPEMLEKVKTLAAKDIEERFSPGHFIIDVLAPGRMGGCRKSNVDALEKKLKCGISIGKRRKTLEVTMLPDTIAKEDQIRQIGGLLFGSDSVVSCDSYAPDSMCQLIGKSGKNIVGLASSHGVHLQWEKDKQATKLLACLLVGSLAIEDDIDKAIVGIKEKMENLQKQISNGASKIIADGEMKRMEALSRKTEKMVKNETWKEIRDADRQKSQLKDRRHKEHAKEHAEELLKHQAYPGHGKKCDAHKNYGNGGLHLKPKGGRHKMQKVDARDAFG